MRYRYLAYTTERTVVKGTIEADSEEVASRVLSHGGYRVVSLKLAAFVFNRQTIFGAPRVKPKDIVMFSRQLALLSESGVDISRALELLQSQTTNTTLNETIGGLIANIREGSSLSTALSKYPGIFSNMYYRTIAAGEQGGNLSTVLRRMAEYIERSEATAKKVRGALTYPVTVFGISIVVVSLLVTYVIPTFGTLYASLGAKLPAMVSLLLNLANWASHFGLFILIIIAAVIAGIVFYVKTPPGRVRWDRFVIGLPVVGRIALLNELSRCCRTMSLLLNVGLPMPEIMTIAIQSAGNKTVGQALTDVQIELMRGEGISAPMSKRPLFLPLMVAMVAVGEETGSLSNTLGTVAESFETESDDKTTAATGLIQPTLTILIAVIVGFIAMVMFQAMYGIYGQFSG